MNFKTCVNSALLSASLVLPGNAVQAEDTVETLAETEQCISLTQLERTDIIDDRNILFYMRGDKIYLNQLPHRCSGLRMADGFSYRRTVNRLCTVDVITTLQSGGPGGLGLRRGISCGLGNFRSITEDEIMVLKGGDAPEADMQGEPAELESLDEDSAADAEIESLDEGSPGEAAESESI